MMNEKLRQLFDYQTFAGNPRLEALLAAAEARCGSALSDDALDFVSAAGDPTPVQEEDDDA